MTGAKNNKVEIIESCMVVPDKDTPKHRLWLSNLDLLGYKGHTPIIYLYKPNGDPNFFSLELLKKALSKALVAFYPLAGRLVLDGDGRPEVDCNAEGALFSVARAQYCTFDEFGDFMPSPTLRRMLVPSVTEPAERSSFLVLFQVTLFQCGGVCLASAIHHWVTDGLASLHFMNAWADIARGAEHVCVPPFLDRTALRARSPPKVLYDPIKYSRDQYCEAFRTIGQTTDPTIFKISEDQLNELKHRYNSEKKLSTFKVMAVHLWRTACKARELSGEQNTRLYLVADARDRLEPPLPPGYLGNAVMRVSADLQVKDLLSKPFELVAAKIEEAVKSLKDEYLRSLVDFLEIQNDYEKKIVIGPEDLVLVSWLGMPIYGADFGWGKPCLMRQASMRLAGQVYLMRSPENDGSISVLVGLEHEIMPRFKEIFYQDLNSILL